MKSEEVRCPINPPAQQEIIAKAKSGEWNITDPNAPLPKKKIRIEQIPEALRHPDLLEKFREAGILDESTPGTPAAANTDQVLVAADKPNQTLMNCARTNQSLRAR
ncbi:MAG: hypothetical protein R3C68_04070 [Myxococcota bacterium]